MIFCARSASNSRRLPSTEVSAALPMKLMISAAVRMPPTELLLIFSLPDSRSVSTVFKFTQRRGLNAFERGDAQQDVVAQLLGELPENIACLVAIEMHQDGGDDLRVLALDQLRHGLRIDPLEALDAAGILAFQNTADVVRRFVFAQRFLKYGAGIAFRIEVQKKRFVLVARLQKSLSTASISSQAQFFESCHRCTEFLHLQVTEMLKHLHSLDPRPATKAAPRFCRYPGHSWPATHCLTTFATSFGSSLANCRASCQVLLMLRNLRCGVDRQSSCGSSSSSVRRRAMAGCGWFMRFRDGPQHSQHQIQNQSADQQSLDNLLGKVNHFRLFP